MHVVCSQRLVGVNVNIEGITTAATEMKSRLQSEVLHPLEQWLSAYRSIKASQSQRMTLAHI